MLYVKDGIIFTEKQLLELMGVMRADPPRQKDLDEWDAYILQPDNPPDGDRVTPLKTASKGSDGLFYRNYDIFSFSEDEIAAYKANTIQYISAKFDDKINNDIAIYYPQFERDSWPDQRNEAELWINYLSNGEIEPSTPIIDALVQEGESKTDYANLILTNADIFKAMAGQYIKELRRIRNAIWDAADKKSIDLIKESLTL